MTTRTRKTAAKPAVKPVTKVEAPKVPARPEPVLTVSDYAADIKARWAVHQHEFKLFVEDVKKGYDFILPFCKRSIDYTVSVYRRFRPVPAQ
jgi:hypothetical protein